MVCNIMQFCVVDVGGRVSNPSTSTVIGGGSMMGRQGGDAINLTFHLDIYEKDNPLMR